MRKRELRDLVYQLTLRDVVGRYRGSFLGIGWSLANPLLMLSLYTFVFSGIFKARWPGVESNSSMLFAINLFAGLIVINMLAEVAAKSATLIVGNTNYVKRVVFPLEVLSLVAVLSATFHAAVSMGLLIIFKILATGSISATIVAIPFLWLPLLVFSFGLSLILSAVGVFIRDTPMLVNIGISLMLFLSPVFFPASAYPERWRPLLNLNPLVGLIEAIRNATILGVWPSANSVAIALGSSIVFTSLSLRMFQKARRAFADVV